MRFRATLLAAVLCVAGFAAAASAQTTINIATVTNPAFVHTKAAEWFKEEVEKALPGKYTVVVHHSAALGSETQVLQQIQLGTTQMSVCTTGPIEAFVPEIKTGRSARTWAGASRKPASSSCISWTTASAT